MEELVASWRNLTFFNVACRLILAMLAGGVIGWGRSRRERPAGLRTYMLISIGAAMSVMLSLYQYTALHDLNDTKKETKTLDKPVII